MYPCKYKNAYDGVWTYGEQCDDGNNDPRDGCNNFQITQNYSCTNILNQPSICHKCPDNCLECQQQSHKIICISCNQNYFNAQTECIPCYEDSCIECETPKYCSICMNQQIPILGKCDSCEYGYYYKDYCTSKCRDGIITIEEQCDDGNIYSNDGCSELCQIEKDFVCQIINNNSHCFIQEQPYLISKLQKSNNEQKQILIWVSQNVTFNDIQIILIDQPQIQKQWIVSGIDSLIIDLKVIFNQSYEYVTINLLIEGVILNKYNQFLIDNKIQIPLRDIIVLSDQEKQTSQQTSKVSKGIVLGLFSISTTTIFIVGISQFVSFLNLIQQLQYIQYINIQFPPHFMQFLNIFNTFSFTPIFELFSIKQALTQIDPQQQIFLSNGMNAYFIANMQGFLFICLLLLICYILLKLSMSVIQRIKSYLLIRQKLNIYVHLNKLQILIQRTSFLIKSEGINQLIFTNCYDIHFAIFFQLNNQSYDSYDLMINNLLAFVNLILLSKFMGNKIKNDEIINNRWQQFYQQVKLMSAFMFTFAIVYLQDFPQTQILIISSVSLISSFYLLMIQPFKKILKNYQLILQELALSLSSLTFVAYIYFPQSVDPIVLGWFHILTFITMLIGNLVIDLYSFVINIKRIYCK